VIEGDQMAFRPYAEFVTPPHQRDRIVRGSQTWEIVAIQESGNGALAKFQCRRASGTNS
jgi:hypothetical protein